MPHPSPPFFPPRHDLAFTHHSLFHPPAWHHPAQNPYPVVQPLQPPPPVAHKVFILDCASCGTFLTNRGMKAVLLLRPDISLYSTDAFPINCSAQSNSEVPRPSTSRTCDCLTQTISCHGCGSSVGYMIVIPCVRCTSSISATNRATNGHRFVFHAGEVVGSERYYIPNEPGVMPYDISPQLPSHSFIQVQQDVQDYIYRPSGTPLLAPAELSSSTSPSSPDLSPASSVSSLPELSPASDSEYNRMSFSNHRVETSIRHGSSTHTFPTFAPMQSHHPLSMPYTVSSLPPQPLTIQDPTLDYLLSLQEREQKSTDNQDPDALSRRSLGPGDVLHWHNLSRNGEIPGVKEDPQARRKGPNTVWCCR